MFTWELCITDLPEHWPLQGCQVGRKAPDLYLHQADDSTHAYIHRTRLLLTACTWLVGQLAIEKLSQLPHQGLGWGCHQWSHHLHVTRTTIITIVGLCPRRAAVAALDHNTDSPSRCVHGFVMVPDQASCLTGSLKAPGCSNARLARRNQGHTQRSGHADPFAAMQILHSKIKSLCLWLLGGLAGAQATQSETHVQVLQMCQAYRDASSCQCQLFRHVHRSMSSWQAASLILTTSHSNTVT